MLFVEWCQEYKTDITDNGKLQQEIDSYMQDYDKKVQKVLIVLSIFVYFFFLICICPSVIFSLTDIRPKLGDKSIRIMGV